VKKSKVLRTLIAVVLVAIAQVANAQTYCVRADATGTGSGADWNNAFRTLPATLVRGATYYIADGSYPGYTCDDRESGLVPITIKKATGGQHGPDLGWQGAYGDGQATFGTFTIMTDNWVIDGVVGGGPGSWTTGHGFRVNGSIQINPTYNNVYTWQVGVDNGGDNVTLRHIEIVGSLTPGTEDAVSDNNNEGLFLSHLYTHETDNCPLNLFYTSNVTWEYSYVGRFTGSPEFHSEILFLYGKGNVSMRYNVFTWVQSTGGLMINNPDRGAVEIYGNVFYKRDGDTWAYGGDGVIGTWINRSDIACHNVSVFNNTFINVPKDCFGIIGSTPSSGLVAKNNYFYNSGTGLPNGSWSHNYNHYQNSGTESEANGSQGSGATLVTLDVASRDFAKLTVQPPAGDTTVDARYRTDWFGVIGTGRGAVQGSGQQVQDVTAPTVTLGTVASQVTGSVTIAAQATDNTGGTGVASVQFLVDGQSIGTDSTAPYSVAWDSRSIANGTHTLQAVATDGAGNRGNSASLTIQVQNVNDATAPTISVTAPVPNAIVSNIVNFAATAADGSGGTGVAMVSFVVNGAVVGTDSTSPYTLSWDSSVVTNGNYVLVARARDAAGNSADSSSVTIAVRNPAQNLDQGLLLYLKFQEDSGVTALDSSGYGNRALLANGLARAGGISGNSLSFDGIDDFARVTNSASLEPSSALTLSLWASVQNNGSWQSLLGKVVQDGAHAYPFTAYEIFTEASGDSFRFRVAVSGTDGNRVYADSVGVMTYGEWYHVAGVYNGSSLKLYINGQEHSSTAYAAPLVKTGQSLFFGRNGAGSDKFKGMIDEVRIFDRALAVTEVQRLGTRPAPPSNLQVLGN